MRFQLLLFLPFLVVSQDIDSSQESHGPIQSRLDRPSTKYTANRKPLEYLMFLYEIFGMFSEDKDSNEADLKHDDSNNCLFVKSEESTYRYKSPGSRDICGLYVVTQFLDFDVSCDDGGLVSVIDGWELNGQFFPTEKDHDLPREKRYTEFCGDKVPYTKFVMGQNVALIEFRIPKQSEGFEVKVSFRENPTPCNVFLELAEGTHNLSNFGRRTNCTVSILFPSSLTFLSLQIGPQLQLNQGLLNNCKNGSNGDFLEIRGGDGLDSHLMSSIDDFCGYLIEPMESSFDVHCGVTSVTLVSSGQYNNSVTLGLDFFFEADFTRCPHSLDKVVGSSVDEGR